MKAVQITKQGGPDVLQIREMPDPEPGPGQILIDVHAAAVNYSDVMRRRGSLYPFPTPLPFIPGAEVAGTVAALGEGVAGPPVGTSVFALVGADGSGGYAELAIAGAQQVIPIPPGLDMAEAAGIVVSGLTATLILTQTVSLSSGDTVFVPAAAGGVGSFAVQIAKLLGAQNVIAAASSPEKCKAALAIGADSAVDYSRSTWPSEVHELCGGGGVDIALEMAGGESLAQTLSVLAPFGRCVVYGMASGVPAHLGHDSIVPMLYDPSPNQSLHAFNLGLWFGMRPMPSVAALEQLIGWVATGAVKVPVGETMALGDAAKAHTLVESRESIGKVVLVP